MSTDKNITPLPVPGGFAYVLKPDDIVSVGTYQVTITRVLAHGGVGEVYVGRNAIGRVVALKILQPEHARHSVIRQRFQDEARLMVELRNVATAAQYFPDVYAYGSDEARQNLNAIAFEFFEGETLHALTQRKGALPPMEAVQLMRQILDAIEAMHNAGVIHRDLKPENIFVAAGRHVKVLDLGIARSVYQEEQRRLTATSVPMGTVYYMSPEQIYNSKTVDARADIFALGALLYETLAGAIAFNGDGPLQIMKAVCELEPQPLPENVPEHVRKAVFRALAKQPEHRFQTAAEFRAALEEPVAAPVTMAPERDASQRTTSPPLAPAPPHARLPTVEHRGDVEGRITPPTPPPAALLEPPNPRQATNMPVVLHTQPGESGPTPRWLAVGGGIGVLLALVLIGAFFILRQSPTPVPTPHVVARDAQLPTPTPVDAGSSEQPDRMPSPPLETVVDAGRAPPREAYCRRGYHTEDHGRHGIRCCKTHRGGLKDCEGVVLYR